MRRDGVPPATVPAMAGALLEPRESQSGSGPESSPIELVDVKRSSFRPTDAELFRIGKIDADQQRVSQLPLVVPGSLH
jgi:hypothetical protein